MSEVPADTVVHFKKKEKEKKSSSSTGELCSQPIRRIGRMFPEHVERSFLDPEYSFVAVRRILRTIFEKQKFAQLRTNYSPNTPTCVREQMFAQLRTGFRLVGRKTFVRFRFGSPFSSARSAGSHSSLTVCLRLTSKVRPPPPPPPPHSSPAPPYPFSLFLTKWFNAPHFLIRTAISQGKS